MQGGGWENGRGWVLGLTVHHPRHLPLLIRRTEYIVQIRFLDSGRYVVTGYVMLLPERTIDAQSCPAH